MGLWQRTRSGLSRVGRWFEMAASDAPAAKAAPEIVLITDGSAPGFGRTFREVDERYRVFRIERERHDGYRDDWTAIEESPIIERGLTCLAEDATAREFDIKCDDKRARDEIWALLDRIRYWHWRDQYLFRLNGTGDLFLFADLDVQPMKRRNAAEITGLRIGPEYTMFRLQDARGFFTDWQKAFMQMPGIEWTDKTGGGVILDSKIRGQDWSGYSGLTGTESGRGFTNYRPNERIFFPAERVIHARLRAGTRPMPTGYGVSAQRSTRVAHNIVMMALQDAAVGRKMTTYNRLHHSLPEGTQAEQVAAYKKEVEEKEPAGPLTAYYTAGGKIEAIDARNWQLKELEDVVLNVELVELGIGYPLAFRGLRTKRVTGEILGEMKEALNATIEFQHRLEEEEILRPVIGRQMFYSGKADVKFEIVWPRSPRLEDINKESKRVVSEVQVGVESRQGGMRRLRQLDPEDAAVLFREIVAEHRQLGAPGGFQRPPENLDKGKKGVEKKPAEEQDVADEYGTGE